MTTVKNYLSLVKFSHTIFAMPFAMIGFALGVASFSLVKAYPAYGGIADFGQAGREAASLEGAGFLRGMEISPGELLLRFVLVLVCMITARSAAMAFNRYLDRHFDRENPRTAIREIPRGIISPDHALRFVILNAVLFIAATWFINKICFLLSPVALFVILFYSYTKRFTPLCHLVLGLGLSLAPIGAYLAVTGRFDVLPVLFSLAVIFWVSGFDVIYALQDVEFDRSQRLYSIPSVLGRTKALRVSGLLHVLSTCCVVAAGIYGGFQWIYWLGIGVFAGMLLYQHAIVKPNDLSRVNIAFMTANGIASIVFGVLVIADIIIN